MKCLNKLSLAHSEQNVSPSKGIRSAMAHKEMVENERNKLVTKKKAYPQTSESFIHKNLLVTNIVHKHVD